MIRRPDDVEDSLVYARWVRYAWLIVLSVALGAFSFAFIIASGFGGPIILFLVSGFIWSFAMILGAIVAIRHPSLFLVLAMFWALPSTSFWWVTANSLTQEERIVWQVLPLLHAASPFLGAVLVKFSLE